MEKGLTRMWNILWYSNLWISAWPSTTHDTLQNPFDEIGVHRPSEARPLAWLLVDVKSAVEEAIRLREKNKSLVESITAVSIGPAKAVDTIRTALAMGADSGIHITTPEGTVVEPISVAHAIKAVIEKNKVDLVIMGKQAIDDDSGSTGGMLAGMLGWGQASFTSKLTIDAGGKVEVTREIDGGLEKLEGKLPMIVTTDLRCVAWWEDTFTQA